MEPTDFLTWLKEDGMRTALGPYPPAYGAGLYPAAYFTPSAADAVVRITTWHPEMLNKPEPKKSSKPKSKSKPKAKKKAKTKPNKK